MIKNSGVWPGFVGLKSDWTNTACPKTIRANNIGYTYCDYWTVLDLKKDDATGHQAVKTVEVKDKFEDKREIMNCSTSN